MNRKMKFVIRMIGRISGGIRMIILEYDDHSTETINVGNAANLKFMAL